MSRYGIEMDPDRSNEYKLIVILLSILVSIIVYKCNKTDHGETITSSENILSQYQ